MGRETGTSRGCLAPAGGAQRRGRRATGRSGAARPGKAPSISYMEGALLHSARQRGFGQHAAPANANETPQPPIIDLALKAGKPRNSRITSATRWMRTASTGPTG